MIHISEHKITTKLLTTKIVPIMKFKGIDLIEVNEKDVVIFHSAIEKEQFIQLHESFEYELMNNAAYLRKYICIDRSFNGFVLNGKGLTYIQCTTLINMYL